MKLVAMAGLSSFDAVSFTSRKITDQGFLEAPAKIARSGVQIFRAGEFPSLLATGMDANTVIRLHRPDEELFSPGVMAKADGLPIIVEPHQKVTADNWKDVAVGDVTGISRDGNFLAANKAMVRDKDAIALVQAGKKFQSLGYTFDLDPTPGTNAQGEDYDGIQRNIVPNHVVICDNPRGGTQCRIGDTQGELKHMIIQIDGIPVEVGNDTAVAAVQKVISERDEARKKQPTITLKIGDASKTITGDAAIIKELSDRDVKITELTSQIKTPEQTNQLVNAAVRVRVAIIGDAIKVIKDYKPEEKSNDDIMREVITAASGNDSAKIIVTALLSGSKVETLTGDSLTTVFHGAVASFKPASGGTTQTDPAIARALAGDTNGSHVADGGDVLVGRDAWLARQARGYKKPKK
jgi:hypothetical protein